MGLWRRIKGLVAPKKTGGTGKGPAKKRTVFNMQVGDIFSYFDTDYKVAGRLIFSEDGNKWYEYMLRDGDIVKWLSADWDDEVEISLTEIVKIDVAIPPPENIEYRGRTYKRYDWGEADVTRIGEHGNRKTDECQYWDYEDAAEEYHLAVEKWGNFVEVSVGEWVEKGEFKIYPKGEI
jgi:hypothetical protein